MNFDSDSDIREPDGSFFDVLAPQEEDNPFDEDLINALNQSFISFEKERDHLKNQEKYQMQIEKLMKEDKERCQQKLDNDAKIMKHNEDLVIQLIRTIIYSGLDKHIIHEIKNAIDLFCKNKTHYILINSITYEVLITFLELKKHRLTQEYIETVLPFIREKIDG